MGVNMKDAIERAIDIVENEKEWPVENEWHYPIMTAAGFVPVTLTYAGDRRRYRYEYPPTKHAITCVMGATADYWVDHTTKSRGSCHDLESHLRVLKGTYI